MSKKNKTDKKRRHKRLFFFILVYCYLTTKPSRISAKDRYAHASCRVVLEAAAYIISAQGLRATGAGSSSWVKVSVYPKEVSSLAVLGGRGGRRSSVGRAVKKSQGHWRRVERLCPGAANLKNNLVVAADILKHATNGGAEPGSHKGRSGQGLAPISGTKEGIMSETSTAQRDMILSMDKT